MTNKISRREGLLAFLGFAAAAAIPEAAVEAVAIEAPISGVGINMAYQSSVWSYDAGVRLWARVLDEEARKMYGDDFRDLLA